MASGMKAGSPPRHLVAPEPALARWARRMVRHRRLVLVLCLFGTAAAALLAGSGTYSGDFVPGGESRRTAQLLADELGRPGRSSFVLVLAGGSDPAGFRSSVERALAPLRTDPRVAQVSGPFDGRAGTDDAGLSVDRQSAYATVFLRDDVRHAAPVYPQLRAAVRADGLTVRGTGDVAVAADLGQRLDEDLAKAELVSFPLALLLLLVVFGTVVAAAVPLVIGALAVVAGTAAAAGLSRVVDMSELTTSVVTLLGLGLAIDYSLFVVSRLRAEVRSGLSTSDGLAVALSTAGRTVLASGLTVVAGLSGLLLFRGSFLPGMGLGAAAAVLLAVGFALTFLPALLAVLGPRIERLPVLRRRPGRSERRWRRLAGGVLRRPWLFIPVLAVLVTLGLPFLHARLDTNDVNQLPAGTEARTGAQLLAAEFPPSRTADVQVAVRFDQDPLSAEHLSTLLGVSRAVDGLPGVTAVTGIVDPSAGADAGTYVARYAADPALGRGLVGAHVVRLDVRTDIPAGDPAAHRLVDSIRSLSAPDAEVLVTGRAATGADLAGLIRRWTPWALVLVVALIYLVLLVALRSVLLPAKAVVLTLLSITASFGALVWIFQDGHLHGVFGTQRGGLDPAVPVLLFSLAFGLSMDYEVLLLTRMQEAYSAGADNVTAVEEGLVRSGPLVTGAAAIMAAVFGSFTVGQVVLVKAIGLGLALAVVADATLVRCVAVPALMRLFGRANWWAPGRYVYGRRTK